jgi:hypothetical protein
MRPVLLLLAGLAACGQAPDKGDPSGDADGDGFAVGEDCDDARASVNPEATELCDGVDNDCDGEVDEPEAFDAQGWFTDADGDGFGDAASVVFGCTQPDGTAPNGADCDDGDSLSHPGADEVCDPADRDEDCDGLADDADPSASGQSTFYGDADGDGWGIWELTTEACDPPDGFAEVDGDCLDTDPTAHPGAVDVWYDGVDSDCAGDNDYDADLDGHGSALHGGGDCDDTLAIVNPDREEVCGNGLDDDCDGTPAGCLPWGEANAADAWARYTGPVAAGEAGAAVAGVGDVDGDGLADMLVGAPGTASGGSATSGVAYLVPGGTSGSHRINQLGTRLIGSTGEDRLGAAVAGPGDADGDGLPDLLVGAPGNALGGEGAGAVFLWLGPATVSVGLSAVDHALLGPAGAGAGSAVAGPGDVDGDGFDDLLVGSAAAGAWRIDRPRDATANLDDIAEARFEGDGTCGAGSVVAALGDLDGDGLPDVGLAGGGCAGGRGRAWVFLGALSGTLSMDDADSVLTGTTPGDEAFSALHGGQDLDGDGYAELWAGVPGEDAGATDAGGAVRFDGPLLSTIAAVAADATLLGVDPGGAAGTTLAWGGDVQADGTPDLLLGAPTTDVDTPDDGAAWLVIGPVSGTVSLSDAAGARIRGSASGSALGGGVAFPGDVDGDGIDDLLLGGPGNGASGEGVAAVFLGGAW